MELCPALPEIAAALTALVVFVGTGFLLSLALDEYDSRHEKADDTASLAEEDLEDDDRGPLF